MATYSQVKKGSKGDSVSQLQTLLNQNGYSLDVDGVFGSKTQSAVRDYQSKSGLAVDGIVGTNTWNSLLGTGGNTSGSASGSSSSSTADWLASYQGNSGYTPSASVQAAANTLAQYEANKPGEYQSTYADQIQGLLDKIMNREEFSYDFASDPMYQQYANRYQQQGKLAMMDTMANAAALSGGYGNSYANTAGQQAYQGYLQQLNDVIPELRDAAYQMYQNKGADMYNQMNLLQGLDNTDYGRYRDTVSDYYNDLNYYYGKYNDLNNFEYGAFADNRNFALAAQQLAQEQARWEAEFALAQQAAKSSGGSGGGGSKKSGGSSSQNSTYNSIVNRAIQAAGIADASGYDGRDNAMDLLQNNVEHGYITQKEAEEIYNKYIR